MRPFNSIDPRAVDVQTHVRNNRMVTAKQIVFESARCHNHAGPVFISLLLLTAAFIQKVLQHAQMNRLMIRGSMAYFGSDDVLIDLLQRFKDLTAGPLITLNGRILMENSSPTYQRIRIQASTVVL